MITENLSTLKIHKLSQEQYDRELAAGNIDENALYLTPDEDENDIGVVAEFDMETAYEENQVYNANTINGLMSEISSVITNAELSNNKTQDIVADQSNAKKYPSSSAVYNYVQDYFNQYEHIIKIYGGDTFIENLNAGIYAFKCSVPLSLCLGKGYYNNIFYENVTCSCDNGSFLFVGGENYSGNLPVNAGATSFKKSVILLRNVNESVAEIITGISTIDYIVDDNGEVTYNASWNGGIVEAQDNRVDIIDASVTNMQYPSAKAVYDYVNGHATKEYVDNLVETVKTELREEIEQNNGGGGGSIAIDESGIVTIKTSSGTAIDENGIVSL